MTCTEGRGRKRMGGDGEREKKAECFANGKGPREGMEFVSLAKEGSHACEGKDERI